MKFQNLFISTALLLSTATIQAAPVYFLNDPVSDRALFLDSAGSITTESFETLWSANTSVSFPVNGAQAFTVTSSGASLSRSSFARGVSDGSYSMAIDEVDTFITFTFDSAITAFGINVNDLSFTNMSFTDNLGNVFNNALLPDNGDASGGPGFENRQFIGLVNTNAFTSVTLSFDNFTNQTGTIFLDRLEYSAATVVPLPASVWLFLSGITLLSARFRRKS